MTKQENQCFRVHTYLKEHKGITGYSAYIVYLAVFIVLESAE